MMYRCIRNSAVMYLCVCTSLPGLKRHSCCFDMWGSMEGMCFAQGAGMYDGHSMHQAEQQQQRQQ